MEKGHSIHYIHNNPIIQWSFLACVCWHYYSEEATPIMIYLFDDRLTVITCENVVLISSDLSL